MASFRAELTTTLVLLQAIFAALPIVGSAQETKPYVVEVAQFNHSSNGLATTSDAVLDDGFVSLTSGEAGIEFCTKLVCLGKVYNKAGAKVPEGKGISFSTKFTFAMMKSRADQVTGDGFVFFIGEKPEFDAGQPNGMFGLFTSREEVAAQNAFFGIEFDTMKNVELNDEDDNHLGVDLNSANSTLVAGADLVHVQLNDGKKIVAWIDYDNDQNRLEARISYDEPGVLKPTEPLLTHTYDINEMAMGEFWVGFSSSSNFGFEQRHLIYDWEFNANFNTIGPHLNGTTTSWARWAAYSAGGIVALGVAWFCVVKYTAFGKKQHRKCMSHVPIKIRTFPIKIRTFVSRLFTRKEEGAEDSDVEKLKPNVDPGSGGDDDDEDEEDAPRFPPGGLKPGAKVGKSPPPNPPTDDDDDEEEDEDEDEDLPPPRQVGMPRPSPSPSPRPHPPPAQKFPRSPPPPQKFQRPPPPPQKFPQPPHPPPRKF